MEKPKRGLKDKVEWQRCEGRPSTKLEAWVYEPPLPRGYPEQPLGEATKNIFEPQYLKFREPKKVAELATKDLFSYPPLGGKL